MAAPDKTIDPRILRRTSTTATRCKNMTTNLVQQHFLLKKDEDKLQNMADKSTLKKRVSKAQVAEIVEPKILKPKKVASKKSKSSAKTTVRVVSASKKGGKK